MQKAAEKGFTTRSYTEKHYFANENDSSDFCAQKTVCDSAKEHQLKVPDTRDSLKIFNRDR